MTPDDLRALAARVLGEEPSRELDADIWDALGLTYAAELAAKDWMRRHKNRPRRDYLLAWSPAFTASHDAAFGAMPAGWRIWGIEHRDDGYRVALFEPDQGGTIRVKVDVDGPTLPRAVTAAGLLARAAEMEAAHAE